MSVAASGSEHCERAIHVVPETDNIVVVCLEGDFDLTNARALDAEIELALDGGNDVILDFSDASFVIVAASTMPCIVPPCPVCPDLVSGFSFHCTRNTFMTLISGCCAAAI